MESTARVKTEVNFVEVFYIYIYKKKIKTHRWFTTINIILYYIYIYLIYLNI